jgi:hypothetical protein
MDKKKQTYQKICLWCNRADELETASLYALYIALFLGKEICFFSNYQTKKQKDLFESRINKLIWILKSHLSQLPYSVLIKKGRLKDLVLSLTEEHESILFCLPGKMSFPLLNAFYKSRTPFLFTKGTDPISNRFQKLVIPVDFRASAKDAALWGSYFGRMNQSAIILVEPDENERELREKVRENLDSILSLYQKFSFLFRLDKGKVSSWRIHQHTLNGLQPSDLFVAAGSYNVSLPDYLIGPFEMRLVNRSKKVPVLLINPRHEVCVLCD